MSKLLAGGGGGLPHPPSRENSALPLGELSLLPNFQKGMAGQDLDFQREIAGKEESDFFQGVEGCSFYIKNKVKCL